MPSIQDWLNGLTRSRRVYVDSSDQVAQSVNGRAQSRSFNGTPKIAQGLSLFSPTREIDITPAELLYYIGRVTTPRSNNLFDLCSTWASIRYVWAFEPDPRIPDLCLSDIARDIDFHQKGVFSDEAGIGMAAFITEKYFHGYNPIDVTIAIRKQEIQGLGKQYATSPDYLFERGDGTYIVVECKGTQSGYGSALAQLKRGTEQVPSLTFPSGHMPLTLVIGTWLSSTQTSVYVIDPPSDGKPPEVRGSQVIVDEQEFRNGVDRAQLSNLFLYVGATGPATELASDEVKSRLRKILGRYEPPERVKISEVSEDYLGVIQRVHTLADGDEVTIFQGLPESLYQTLEKQDKKELLVKSMEYYEKTCRVLSQSTPPISTDRYLERDRMYTVDQTKTALRVQVFGRDGTMLRIEISSRA